MDPEEMYQNFCRHINSVNEVISTYKEDVLGECALHPERGNVAFSAGRHGWVRISLHFLTFEGFHFIRFREDLFQEARN